MRERCDFYRSTIAIENAFTDYTVFIPRIRTRIAVAIENASIDYTVFMPLSQQMQRHRSIARASQSQRTRITVATVN
jgi:hypothetical protein